MPTYQPNLHEMGRPTNHIVSFICGCVYAWVAFKLSFKNVLLP
jgi:hypothetical protein